MQTTQRAKQNTPEEQDKRKEKERKREEKELRKIAAAAGVRMAKPSTASTTTLAPVVPSAEPKPIGFKKSSWASVSSVTPELPLCTNTTESPPARRGWGAVRSSSHSPSPAPDATSSAGFPMTTPVVSSQPGDPSKPEPAKEAQRQHHQPAPAFRTGGWSSIDSTTRIPPPPLTPAPDVPPSAMANLHRQERHLPSSPASASITPSAPETVPAADHLPPPVQPHSQAFANPRTEASKSSKSKKVREAEMRENSRSGWQSFQRGGRRK